MEAVAEKIISAKNPATRQVLANVGNRYVVFGTQNMLPGTRMLGPSDVKHHFSERVGDEFEFPHDRLVRSIVVDGCEIVYEPAPADHGWDLELIYPDHSKSIVEIKVRTRDFVRREFDRNIEWLRALRESGVGNPEVWNFNIERLRLVIMNLDDGGMPQFYELDPLNIWEFNSDGSVFERSYVVGRVDDWMNRIANVYSDVENWSRDLGVDIDKSRTVRMSEEMMQKFAVPDRDLHILDVSRAGTALLSFVPIGLWIFGSNGRIDIISRNGTTLLLDRARPPSPSDWAVLLDRFERTFEQWSEESFLKLFKAAEAP